MLYEELARHGIVTDSGVRPAWRLIDSLLILVSTCVGAVSFHIHRESLYVCISLNNMD